MKEAAEEFKKEGAGPRLSSFLQQLATVHRSPLLAWRQTVDPDAHLHASFQDLCRGCAKMDFADDVAELWRELDGDNSGTISFSEVAPVIGRVLESLRKRVTERGDSAIELFAEFDNDKSGSVDEEEFIKGCHRSGYNLPAEDLAMLFHALDTDGSGLIHQGEMALLEEDPVVRRQLERQFREGVTTDITALRARAKERMSPAPRKPWQQMTSSQMLMARRAFQARKEQVAKEALIEFHHHLLRAYGNIVRAWRRGLDKSGKMSLDKKDLLRYLRTIEFQSDGELLFQRLDADRDGSCNLEELDPLAADVIAHFRLWAFKKFPGGCLQAFDSFTAPQISTDETRSFTVSPAKRVLRFATFEAGCKRLGFRLMHKEPGNKKANSNGLNSNGLCMVNENKTSRTEADHWLKYLFDCLDYSGIGTLTRFDFAFVQNWQPPPWFVVPPDVVGLNELRRQVLDSYGNFVRGWRKALDLHGNNRISWAEFVRNCNSMGFVRNLPGIFSALDPERTGWISLKELDRASHEYLRSFKTWADNTFGGVVAAFQALDINADAELTLTELRKAAKRYGWGGSVKTLFRLLDTENEHRLTAKGVQFLDEWELDHVDKGRGHGIFEVLEPNPTGSSRVPNNSAILAKSKKFLKENTSSSRSLSPASVARCNSAPRLGSSSDSPNGERSHRTGKRNADSGALRYEIPYNPAATLAQSAGLNLDELGDADEEIIVESAQGLPVFHMKRTGSCRFAPVVRASRLVKEKERKKKKHENVFDRFRHKSELLDGA